MNVSSSRSRYFNLYLLYIMAEVCGQIHQDGLIVLGTCITGSKWLLLECLDKASNFVMDHWLKLKTTISVSEADFSMCHSGESQTVGAQWQFHVLLGSLNRLGKKETVCEFWCAKPPDSLHYCMYTIQVRKSFQRNLVPQKTLNNYTVNNRPIPNQCFKIVQYKNSLHVTGPVSKT
jgi:hypothetical protein